ncbi:MAG TPA: extracellular solute-binding protein [Clostridiaceae bacterium]
MYKKGLSIIMFVFLITSLFVGCGNKKAVPTVVTAPLVDDMSQHYKYTIMQGKQFDVPAGNSMEQFLNKKFNATFEFMLVPRGQTDYQNKLNLLMASGDMPDLIQLNDLAIEKKMVDQGLIMPLDDLVTKYGAEMKKIRPDALWDPFKFNGKLYSVPNQFLDTSAVPIIRTDWLNKLGLPIPTTIEEYETAIKAFTENDPDGNGKNDTYGISGSNAPIMDSFSQAFEYEGISYDGWKLVNGQLTYMAILPEAKAALKRINTWFKNGWIDPQFPIYTRDKFEEIIGQGKFGSYTFDSQRLDPAFDIGLKTLYDKDKNAKFLSYAPVKNKDGKQNIFTGDQRSIGYTMAISAKCEHPERLMELMNYAASEEGYMRIRYGEEGVNYKKDDKGIVQFINGWTDVNKRTQAGMSIQYSNLFRRVWLDSTANQSVWDADGLTKKYGTPNSPIYTTTPAMLTSSFILNQLRDDSFAKIVSAKNGSDVDKMFDDFVTKWESGGGDAITKEINAEYIKNKK